MATIVTRSGKGSPLTNDEVDANFTNLNDAKIELTDISVGPAATADGSGAVSYDNTTGVITYTPPEAVASTLDAVTTNGNTTTNDITVANVTADSLQITGGTGTQGTLSWNTEEETLDLIVSPDVTYQLGQEMGVVARNLSGTALTNGSVVIVTGASGDKVTIDLADASAEPTSAPTIGVVTETIGNNSTGRVTTAGLVRGLDTSGLTEGAAIYLGLNGTFTTVQPVSPNHLVHIGWVVRSHATEGAILVHVNNGWELDELHDVLITDITNNEILQWNAAANVWENRTLAEAGVLTAETDTLDSVTGRGATTTNNISTGDITATALYTNAIRPSPENTGAVNIGSTSYPDAISVREGQPTYIRAAADRIASIAVNNTVEINGNTNFDDAVTAASFATKTGTSSQFLKADGSVDSSSYLTTYTETDPTVPAHVKSITTTDTSNWDTAYSWGDHSTEGYATTTYVDTSVADLVDSAPATLDTLNELAAALGDDPNFATTVSTSIGTKWTQDNTKISNWDTAYSWGDHANAGYLTSYTETDPTVPAHVKSITTTEKSNWNTAYGWGNHASAGYLVNQNYVENYNHFGGLKLLNDIDNNILLGREDLVKVTADGIELTGVDKTNLFNGSADSGWVTIDSGSAATRTILLDLIPYGFSGAAGITYSAGKIRLQFYYNFGADKDQPIQLRVKDKDDIWSAPVSFTEEYSVGGYPSQWIADVPIPNWVTAIEITYTQRAGQDTRITGISYQPNRMGLLSGGNLSTVHIVKEPTSAANNQVLPLAASWAYGHSQGTINPHPFSDITNTPTTLSGYGITDAATATQGSKADSAFGWGDHANAGYQSASTALTTSTAFSGDVSGTYNAIVIADDSHNHIISNVDGLQAALDGKVDDSQVLTNVPAGAVFTDTTYTSSNGILLTGTNFAPTYGTTANTVAQGNDSRINNGQTAFGWGDHATAGYLTSYTETDTLDSVTDRGATTTNAITVGGVVSGYGVFNKDPAVSVPSTGLYVSNNGPAVTGGTPLTVDIGQNSGDGVKRLTYGEVDTYDVVVNWSDATTPPYRPIVNTYASGHRFYTKNDLAADTLSFELSQTGAATFNDISVGNFQATSASSLVADQSATALISNNTSAKSYPDSTVASFNAAGARYDFEFGTSDTITNNFNFVHAADYNISVSQGSNSDIDRFYLNGISLVATWDKDVTCKQYVGFGNSFFYRGQDANSRTTSSLNVDTLTLKPNSGTQTITNATASSIRIDSTDGQNTTINVSNAKGYSAGFTARGLGTSGLATVNLTSYSFFETTPTWGGTGSADRISTTITDLYGIKLTAPSSEIGLTVTNNWGVYQDWSAATNYFAGNVGIAKTNPATALDVNGTVTATGGNSNNWNTAYGWGNHASAGYQASTTWTANDLLINRSTTSPDTAGDVQGITAFYSPSSAVNKPPGTDHSLLTLSYSALWQTQIAGDWRNSGRLYVRGQNNGTWSGWNQIWDSSDFSSADITNWNTAYGWGNHASAGYLPLNTGAYSGTYNIPIIANNQLYPNLSGGSVTITGSTGQITTPSHGNSSQWNTAYGWGNHASAGYLTNNTVMSDQGTMHLHSGSSGTDPDTTDKAWFLTNSVNGPNTGHYYHVQQWFWSSKTATANRAQLAIQYNGGNDVYVRSYFSPSWTSWSKLAKEESLASYLPLSGGTLTGLLAGKTNTVSTVAASNDTGGFSVRGSATVPAAMSFHRAGAYAVNFGLSTSNVMELGGWSAGTIKHSWDMSGNYTAVGNVTAYSDARVKENVKTIDNALEKVCAIRGVTFDRTDEDLKNQMGVIAQEVLEVVPEVVDYNEEKDRYTVAYGNMVGLLIEAVKDLKKEIEELKNGSAS